MPVVTQSLTSSRGISTCRKGTGLLFTHLTALDRKNHFCLSHSTSSRHLSDQEQITSPCHSCKGSWESKFQLPSAFIGIEVRGICHRWLARRKKLTHTVSTVCWETYFDPEFVLRQFFIPPHPQLYPHSLTIHTLYNILWMTMSELAQRLGDLSTVNEALRTTSKVVDNAAKVVHLGPPGLGAYALP